MTKIVFQVGLLAFCVAAVLFGTQGMPLFDILARGFIVFIAVVTMQVVILMVATSMKAKGDLKAAGVAGERSHETPASGSGAAARSVTTPD